MSPKLKESQGIVSLQSPLMDELQRWLCYELVNLQEWNKDSVVGGMRGVNRWEFTLVNHWTISFDGKRILVNSTEPVVHIRKGLLIRMGDGRLELS